MKMKHWAMQYDNCQSCGTTETPHHGKGLCHTCYFREYKQNPPAPSNAYQKGYEIGRTAGREQAINALNEMLSHWDAHCYIHTNIAYLDFQGQVISRRMEGKL